MDSQNEHAEPLDRQVKVFNPPANAPAIGSRNELYNMCLASFFLIDLPFA